MYIRRFFLLCVVLTPTTIVVAADYVSGFSDGLMHVPGSQSGFVSANDYNPWAVPQLPVLPRYSAVQKTDAGLSAGLKPSVSNPYQSSVYQRRNYNPYYQSATVRQHYSLKYNQKYSPRTAPDINAPQPRYAFRQPSRYVTPGILEALKKQQMRMQQTRLPRQYNYYQKNRNNQNLTGREFNSPAMLANAPLSYQSESLPMGLSGRNYNYNRNFNPFNFEPFGNFTPY